MCGLSDMRKLCARVDSTSDANGFRVIFMSIYLVLLFLLIPETTYNRPKRYNTDVHEQLANDSDPEGANADDVALQRSEKSVHVDEKFSGVSDTDQENEFTPERRKTWVQGLKLYNGRFNNENYGRAILSPFITFALPAVHWAAYAYGLTAAFAAAISVCLAQIFSVAPYNFRPGQIGLMVLSPFVGNIIGNLVPGPVADWLVTYMSRKNGGIYEPEFRNILCIPALIIGTAGFWGFGLCIHYRTHWFAPVFCFGLTAFGGAIMSLVSNTYLLDCHRQYSQDAYAVVTLVKAIASFSISFLANDWLRKYGPINVFFTIGSIHAVGCLYGLFRYVFGKRVSSLVHMLPLSPLIRQRYAWRSITRRDSRTRLSSVAMRNRFEKVMDVATGTFTSIISTHTRVLFVHIAYCKHLELSNLVCELV